MFYFGVIIFLDICGIALSFFQSAWDNTKWDGNVDGITTKAENDAYYDKDYIPLMSKTLDSDGFPLVEKYVNPHSTNTDKVEKGSLKYLFDPEMGKNNNGFVQGSGSQTSYNTSAETVSYQSQHFSVNNPTSLFKRNPDTGLYYYDSLLNAAYFQRDKDSDGKELTSGNFNLYDYTERRYGNGYATGKDTTTGLNTTSGHFFPFNIGHISGNINYNGGTRPTITADNSYVTSGAPAPVDYKFEKSTNVDTWFGMSLECEFKQTSDGTFNGQDMIFEFKGDDDVWVYIDDVLVLDIGGAHTPREGSVNFRTGEVTYPGRDASTGKVSGTVNTNLRALFESAAVSTKDFNVSGEGETNTFKSDSNHNLKFFILERGGADSYFHLVFNLPKGTPSITKEVDYSDSNFNDNRDYRFKIEQYNSDTSKYEKFGSDVNYLLEDKDGTSVDGNKLTDGCFFTLKAGQTAYFHNIDDGTQFRVTEFYDTGISKTTAQYTKSYIDENGNRTIADENGNRVAVDDNGNIVTDGSGKVVRVDNDGNIMTDGSGTYQTYDYKLKEFTDTNARSVGLFTIETNVEQNVKFTNLLQTTGLTINEEVYSRQSDGENWAKVESVPGAVYKFSLRLFRKNSDGKTEEYGQKDFSIKGDNLSEVLTFENLPVGASYELWEYYPDDKDHYYVPPEFKRNSQTDNITGSFVIAGNSPGLNSGINGVLVSSGDSIPNSITITNKYILGQQVIFDKTDDKQSADIGETVTYTITSQIPDTTGYESYTYKITDTMSSGLTFTADDVSVKVKGTDTPLVKDTDYTYSRNGNSFELNINVKNLQSYVNKYVVVTYSAVVNRSAVVKIETNKAQIEYSINPVDLTETVKSGEYKEAVYSSKIVVDKYKAGEEATKLSGAEFYLYKNVNGSKKYYQVDSTSGVVSWVDDQNTATKKTTDANGATNFDGIADGIYYLEEVKAPDGYNKLAEDEKVIVNGGGENPVEENLTVTKNIENRAGAKLPESGSTGLLMYFIIGGGIILMCSLLLIVFRIRPSRKR